MIIDNIFLTRIVLLIFPAMLFLLCYLQKVHSSEWVVPSTLFCLYWAFLLTIALLMPLPVPVMLIGVLILFLHLVVFLLPGFFFQWRPAFNLKKAGVGAQFDIVKSKRLLWMFICVALLALIFNLHANGVLLSSYIENPVAASQHFIALRYSQKAINTVWSHISRISVFMLFVIFPFAYDLKTKKGFKVLFLIFLLPLLFVILYGDKGTILLCAAIFYGSNLGYNVMRGCYQPLLGLNFRKVVTVFFSFLCLVCLMFYLRYGSLYDLGVHVFAYAAGWLFAFSDWVHHYYLSFSNFGVVYHDVDSHGILTYTPIAKLFGCNIRLPDGLYAGYPSYHGIHLGNVYTLFRGTITDFGLLGSLLYIFIVSLACNMSFYMLLVYRASGLFFAVFVLFVMWAYTSYICSIFIWKSPYFLFFMIFITVNMLKCRVRLNQGLEV